MRMRRGACPTLLKPMQTGDGLLARLAPIQGRLTPKKMSAIAKAAARHGNGIIEITARGKLQVRGLTAKSAAPFAAAIGGLDLGVVEGFGAETGPLAGLNAGEIADPRPLARAIEAAVTARDLAAGLAPKLSVVVDGGGALPLDALGADIRLEAVAPEIWRVALAGTRADARALGTGSAEAALSASLALLRQLADAGPEYRARDLDAGQVADSAAGLAPAGAQGLPVRDALPVGLFALHGGGQALGIALPFAQARAAQLEALCAAAAGAGELRLAPRAGLLAIGLSAGDRDRLRDTARALGFITAPDDPWLAITACAGAPACASARLDTRALAAEVAAGGLLKHDQRLHLSGCEKRCARPPGATLDLIADAGGPTLGGVKPPDRRLSAFLLDRAAAHAAPPARKPAR